MKRFVQNCLILLVAGCFTNICAGVDNSQKPNTENSAIQPPTTEETVEGDSVSRLEALGKAQDDHFLDFLNAYSARKRKEMAFAEKVLFPLITKKIGQPSTFVRVKNFVINTVSSSKIISWAYDTDKIKLQFMNSLKQQLDKCRLAVKAFDWEGFMKEVNEERKKFEVEEIGQDICAMVTETVLLMTIFGDSSYLSVYHDRLHGNIKGNLRIIFSHCCNEFLLSILYPCQSDEQERKGEAFSEVISIAFDSFCENLLSQTKKILFPNTVQSQ